MCTNLACVYALLLPLRQKPNAPGVVRGMKKTCLFMMGILILLVVPGSGS
jgi:hypothetical protein